MNNTAKMLLAMIGLIGLSITSPALEYRTNFNGLDLDGKSRDDLGVYASESGVWIIVTPAGVIRENWGWENALPAPGDYNGDGAADLSVFLPDSGQWYVRTTTGLSLVSGAQWGWSRTVPAPADYDGDGTTDLGVYHRETGNWYIRTVDGALLAWAVNWGWAQTEPFRYQVPSGRVNIIDEVVPVPADYDGDGTADLAVYHRRNGAWYIYSLTKGVIAMGANWGWREARPVPGDYNGDGKADLAVYHRATGNWYVRTLSGDILAWAENWGWRETTPVPGDYNGDQQTDLGVYHRLSGRWYVRSLNGAVIRHGTQWGWEGTPALQSFASPASDGVEILCFGDSTTWGGGSSSDSPDTGYPVRLEKMLRNRFGGLHSVRNAGNPGEATWDGRERLPVELDKYQPELLLLMEGVNDALFDFMFVGTEQFMREMVNTSLSRNVPLVIGTIPPVMPSVRSNQYERIKTFNPRIHAIASDYSLPVAPVFESITAQPYWEYTLMEPISANHPNDDGYKIVTDTFFDQVQEFILSGAAH